MDTPLNPRTRAVLYLIASAYFACALLSSRAADLPRPVQALAAGGMGATLVLSVLYWREG